MKQSLSSLQNTQTHVHILTVEKEETKSSTRSEWRTNFTSLLCRLNNLTYSMSCYSTPSRPSRCLLLSHAHTLSMIHVRVTEALRHPRLEPHRAQRAKERHWYRDSSLYCIYTTYCRPSLYSDMLIGELRDPGQLQSVGFGNLTRVWKSLQV